jgi:hypothetical protein
MHTKSLPYRRLAYAVLRGLHFIGMTLFLGVIVADIVIDRYARTQSATFLADARTLVSVTGLQLPLFGLALLALTGFAMTALRYGSRPPGWVVAKLVLTVAIFGNALAFLFPAIRAAAHWAAVSAAQGQVLPAHVVPEYAAAAAREGAFGAANLVMFVLAGALAIWKPVFRRGASRGLAAAKQR